MVEDLAELKRTSRSRGRGRINQKKKKKEKRRGDSTNANSSDLDSVQDSTHPYDQQDHQQQDHQQQEKEGKENEKKEKFMSTKKKTSKQDDHRRCIGRKPVTDFPIGSLHTGKVVYVKSNLGVFLDIGCHSDAFCHISQLVPFVVRRGPQKRDESLDKEQEQHDTTRKTSISPVNPDANSILSTFQIGETLTRVQVMDTNRKMKRITVRLLSLPPGSGVGVGDDDDDDDNNRQNGIHLDSSLPFPTPFKKKEEMNSAQNHSHKKDPRKKRKIASMIPSEKKAMVDVHPTNPDTIQKYNHSNVRHKKRNASEGPSLDESKSGTKNPTTETNFKRERKLARRAERRLQQQQEQVMQQE